jgi:hypothetical protein
MFAQVFPIQEKRVISLLEETYQKYKGCDVWELVEESHRGPWEKTRNELDEEEISNKEIELEDLFKFVINDYLRDEKEKENNFTIKTIGSDVKEIKNILENASQSEQKVEFFRKLSQLNPQELEEIHDTEEMLNNFSKVRIKY